MCYDPRSAVLDFGHNPRLQILIAKKKDGSAPRNILSICQKVRNKCSWTPGMPSWSLVKIHYYTMLLGGSTQLACVQLTGQVQRGNLDACRSRWTCDQSLALG